jgi:tetratricopeptide (TPR) repeat protein/transcriptional regulator with XRE-family HTH domain
MLFRELLKQYRLQAGLAQRELAKKAGISDRQILKLERGETRTARASTARLLAFALDLADGKRTEFIEAALRGQTADDAAGGRSPFVLRTLPRDSATFTGRIRRLEELMDSIDREIAVGGVLPIHAVDGMAGVGKTVFMVHAAHQLADRFPDGQLFIPLHAHTPGIPTADPRSLLGDLLIDEKVVPSLIPDSLEARADLWRSRTAGRRMLMLLDDASGSEQVRPFLPSAPGSLVLVTSRRRLRGLDGIASVSLELLSEEEAAILFVRVAARPGLSPDDSAIGKLTELCACLPLAIRMIAGRLSGHDGWSPGDLIPELTAASGRLASLYDEELTVAAAFDLSCRDLSDQQRELFRLLGAHPGADADAYAAAALLGADLTAATRLLRDLEDHHLIDEPVHGRYRMHDLVREHAQALAESDESGQARADEAMTRLLDFYLSTAQQVSDYLVRTAPVYAPAVARPPRGRRVLEDRDVAAAWMRDELDNLIAAVDWAAARAWPQAVALPAAMHAYLDRYGPWTTALELHALAAQTADRLGDRPGLAAAQGNLGRMLIQTGDYPSAERALQQALDLYRQLGSDRGQADMLTELGRLRYRASDRAGAIAAFAEGMELYQLLDDQFGQASILNDRGRLCGFTGDIHGAERAYAEALDLYVQLGDSAGQARVLNDRGRLSYSTSDYGHAGELLTQALELYVQLGDLMGQANTLDSLGVLRYMTGDFPGAVSAHAEARDLSSRLGYRVGLANTLDNLGRVRWRLGDYPGAAAAHEQALALYRDLGQDLGQVNALISLGRARYEDDDLASALAALEQALQLSREIDYLQGEANVLDGLGRVRHAERDYPNAIGCYERALLLYRHEHDREGEAESLNHLADTLTAIGRVSEALPHLESALSLARECGSPVDEAEALERTGEIALGQGRTAEGTSLLSEALAIYARLGLPGEARVSARLRIDPAT